MWSLSSKDPKTRGQATTDKKGNTITIPWNVIAISFKAFEWKIPRKYRQLLLIWNILKTRRCAIHVATCTSETTDKTKEQLGTNNIDEGKKAALIILQLITALLCADASFSNMINKHDSPIDDGCNQKFAVLPVVYYQFLYSKNNNNNNNNKSKRLNKS